MIDLTKKDYKFIKDLQSLIIGGRGNCRTIQNNVINAIKNGTPYNPTGDLISRSEAKKLGATCLARRNENGQLEAIISLDNAQTIEFPPVINMKPLTAEEKQGLIDALKKSRLTVVKLDDKESRGEWIVIHNALGETKYQCDQCQHYVKPSDDKNFCPNCGAKMKIGGET